MKEYIKKISPKLMIKIYHMIRVFFVNRKFKNLSNSEIFSIIYKEKIWNSESSKDFDSGWGSHEKEIINPYISRVNMFLKSKDEQLVVVDLGCGDFNVGKNLVEHSKRYIGVDIVKELVERNKLLFNVDKLEFLNLDILKDELPSGDCIFIRQVLQHLSNNDISRILGKFENYRYVVVTEEVPLGNFVSNLDKPTGKDTRMYLNSGLDIEKPPFNFETKKKEILIKIKTPFSSCIISTLYENW